MKVDKKTFDDFVAKFPRPLEKNVVRFCEPPLLQYNDFSDGKVWPESVVCSVVLNESYEKDGPEPYKWSPNEYLIDDNYAQNAPPSGE